jgi:hypothetical protein
LAFVLIGHLGLTSLQGFLRKEPEPGWMGGMTWNATTPASLI